MVIDGRRYCYTLKGGRHGRLGWSAKTLKLIVEISSERQTSNVFESKLWTAEHGANPEASPAHRASFKEADVQAVVRALESNGGVLPERFELPLWVLVPDVSKTPAATS